MTKVEIKRNKLMGSVQETFRESGSYFIDKENAKMIGEGAGLIAVDVKAITGGYEFYLTCSEEQAKKEVLQYNGVQIEFV